MAYRAEIEIGVKGTEKLRELRNTVDLLANKIDTLDSYADLFKSPIQSLKNYNQTLRTTAKALEQVELAQEDEATAIRQYVQALGEANTARARQNGLIEQQIALQEAARRVIQPGPTGFSSAQYGPALPPALIKQQEDQQTFKKLFADLNETAKVISVSNTNTRTSWQTTFDQLNETAKAISVSRLNTKKAWQDFFEEATTVAEDLRQSAARVSLREQERPITVQENISRGRSARIARKRSAFLLGSSGPVQLGPSGRAPGTSGFPVAVPLSKAEQKAVDLQNRKLQILGRIRKTRQDLVGLAANLQRLDNNAVIAIKDANRQQEELNRNKQKSLEISKAIAKSSPIGGAENIPGSPAFLRARSKRRREAASNALIGGAFPLLFGQGIGAAAGGALGGGAGGLLGGQFGFGLSLVGTAAGTAIDTLVAKTAELGKALDPVSGNVDTIIQSLGLANTATGKYIKALEQVAGKQVALEEATKQLALVVGDEGVQALREFGEASTELGKAVSQFVTLALAEAAKLLKGPVQNVASGLTSLSLRAQATRSTDPRQQELVRQASSTQSIEEQARLFKEIEALQRQINEQAEKEAKARLAALDPSNAALKTAERRLAIEQLNGDILNDQVFNLEKQQLAADLITERTELRRKAEGNVALQATLQNRLKKLQVEYETALVTLVNKRGDAEEEAAKKAKRALDRRMREFKRLQKEQQRADEQREKQLDAAVIAELNSVNKLMSVDLQRVKIQDGEMAALKMRQKQIKQELKNKLEILKVQYLQQVQNLKSVEEAKKLYEAYLNQDSALRKQSEIERILVINAEKRLRLAREQQVLDENRARRGQLEGVRREGSRFSMQLDDPFNLNPERQRAFETEIRTAQILRTEREKLADLERESRTMKLTESAENVKLLAEQIDRQRAFIPALEAELALRNELEAAAFKQAETIQKYGFLANELSTAMTSAVQAVVTGTGTVEEAFSTMFANIGKAFIDMATQMMAQKLFMTVLSALSPGGINPSGAFNIGLAAGRANGGPVSPGSTYLVGERGPELLTMTPSGGYVTNNSASQAAMDRYSSGNTRGGAISVNYNVTEINGMKFVTEDQFRAGISQAAKQGADGGFNRTMSSLKNSRSTRSRVGV